MCYELTGYIPLCSELHDNSGYILNRQ
jgi:hypothetical protein